MFGKCLRPRTRACDRVPNDHNKGAEAPALQMFELTVTARSPGPRSKIMVADSIFGNAAALIDKINPRPSIASQDQPSLSYRKRRGSGHLSPQKRVIATTYGMNRPPSLPLLVSPSRAQGKLVASARKPRF